MKYIYSESFQEAAIINHRGIYAVHAAEKLMNLLKSKNKPCMSVIVKNRAGGLISYNRDDSLNYGKHGDFGFCGFGTACVCHGIKSNYRHSVKRYKVRTL